MDEQRFQVVTCLSRRTRNSMITAAIGGLKAATID
jgi:hypothetical protein